VSFIYDPAGRVTSQTLADGRVIGFSYDANGNVASVTPPSRPAHAFDYTPVNLQAAYTPPDVGTGNTATTYTYNADRQPTQVTRPDGQTLTLGYDSGGRLSTLTQPRGQTSLAYTAITGTLASIAAPGGSTLSYTYDGALLTASTWAGPAAGSVTRTFDTDFRVASEGVNGGNTISLQYDPDSRLTGAGALTLARDPQNGLLTGTTLGNLTDAYTYSTFGELSRYQAQSSGSPLLDVQYTRDALGRITQKTETRRRAERGGRGGGTGL
jgi:YD repeat-containing protein